MNKVIRSRRVAHRAEKLVLGVAAVPLLFTAAITDSRATEPCGDFGECKVLIEINASDGDVGFHFLSDADDQRATRLDDPNGAKVWEDTTSGPLREQKKTETFVESSEPPCSAAVADDDELDDVVTIEDFRDLWEPGTYAFRGKGDGGEMLSGETELTYYLPAAPVELEFDGGVISWEAGDDLGECARNVGDPEAPGGLATIQDLLGSGVLAMHPENVPVRAWEIVLEPDVEDGDPLGKLKFTIRLPGYMVPDENGVYEVTVPQEYLDSLPDDTPAKMEVGAIGGNFEGDEGDDDNATFSEEDELCINEDEGCGDGEE